MVLSTAILLSLLFFSEHAICTEDTERFEVMLIGVQDTYEGVMISLSSATEKDPTPQMLQMQLPNSHLSPECGHDFIRCQNLFVESFDMGKRVIFVPLDGGLALVTINAMGSPPLVENTTLRSPGCSPSAVYKILEYYFTVCSNSSTNNVSVLEVRLNEASLKESALAQASQLIVPWQIGNITNVSNFLHLEIDRNHEYIIFALGTAFFYLSPLDYSSERIGDVPNEFCDSVDMLVPLGGTKFYAYCTDHLFTYDIGYEDWLFRDTFSRIGIPYSCPQPHTNVSVFDHYIHLQFNSVTENVDIEGDAYSSGLCFGTAAQNYFAFTDEVAGLHVLNLTSSEWVSSVSTSGCQEVCYPLIAVGNRYLIVRDTQEMKMLVFDFFGDQLELIETPHTVAPLVTLLQFEQLKDISDRPPINKIRTNPGPIVGPTVSLATLFIITCGILVGVITLYRCHQRRTRIMSVEETQPPVEEMCGRAIATEDSSRNPNQESPTGRQNNFECAGTTCQPIVTDQKDEDTSTTKSESDSCSIAADDTPLIGQPV